MQKIKTETKKRGKKLYGSPHLVVYGNLQRLTTAGKGGARGDGAAGNTKS